jgi:hypothetical protein
MVDVYLGMIIAGAVLVIYIIIYSLYIVLRIPPLNNSEYIIIL